MAGAPRILIAGGAGVFGRLLARELLDRTHAHLSISSRDARKAARTCRDLRAPDRVRPVMLDLGRPGALAEAARDCVAVACTAGPFQSLDRRIVREATNAGAHWLDIADAPAWVDAILVDKKSVLKDAR